MHAEVKIGDSRIMIAEESEMAKATPSSLYLYVPNVDSVYEQAIKAGARRSWSGNSWVKRLNAHDAYDARQIVGQHVQRHLGGNLRQTLHQQVRRSHPHLQRAEGMLHRLAALAHCLRVLVETLLYRLQNLLVLPACDAPLRTGRAAMFVLHHSELAELVER